MTNAALVLVLARALRAAADELERGAAPSEPREPAPPPVEISELSKARAAKILRDLDSG